MNQLLTLKHWQLFGLLVGLPLAFQLILTVSLMTSENSTALLVGFPILLLVFTGLFFSWFYTLGMSLHSKLPASAPMSSARFKSSLLLPVTYIFLIMVVMMAIFWGSSKSTEPHPMIFAFVVPLHLVSMGCIFYCLRFVAKALKSVELQRETNFSDYIGELLMFWFFPIGIWALQPRLNIIFSVRG